MRENHWSTPAWLRMLAAVSPVLLAWDSPGRVAAAEPLRIPPPVAEEVDYARQIQPLLVDRCLECHGPDAQESNFRVDRRHDLLDGGDIGEPAVQVGRSEQSHLIRIVAGVDPDLMMPPNGDPLTEEQIGLLRAWIDQGLSMPDGEPAAGPAVESTHWSLQKIAKPMVPEIAGSGGAESHNPIDAFVLRRLRDAGLEHSPPADRATLIRRIYLDMLGLLPSPAEVADFVADPRPDADTRLVDRVLADPRYGERWARHWLDVVRFAESNGFETNHERPNAYHYRDYVVRALNGDLPFDQFVFEQLAGDTVGADAATGFLVAGAHDIVSSPDPALTAMQRQDELADMINTTGTALLGLTVGCARCHNHKFDPITQVDYYAMQAVFAGVQHGERPLLTPDVEHQRRLVEELNGQVAAIEDQLAQLVRAGAVSEPHLRRMRWIDDAPAAESDASTVGARPAMLELVESRGRGLNAAGRERGQRQDAGGAGRLPNVSGGEYTWWSNVPGQDVAAYAPAAEGEWRIWLSWGCGWETHSSDARYLIDLDGDLASTADQSEIARVDQQRFADGSGDPVAKPLWSGFFDAGIHRLQPQSRIVLRGGTTGSAITADVVVLEQPLQQQSGAASIQPNLRAAVSPRHNEERFAPRPARFVRLTIAATNNGIEPCLDELEIWSAAGDGQPSRNVALASAGASARSSGDYSGNPKHVLPHVHDGRYGNDYSWISHQAGRGWVEIELPTPTVIDRITWGRDHEEQYRDRLPVEYQIEVAVEPDQWQVVASSGDRLPADLDVDPLALQLARIGPEGAEEARALSAARDDLLARIGTLLADPLVYAGTFTTPGPTHRLYRGDPAAPREQVAPDTVSVLGALHLPVDAPESQRRVALAESILAADNPLTARVIANRVWHYHFGHGLVATPSDFGAMGAAPSHPELLDWLAAQLRTGFVVGESVAENSGAAAAWSLKHLHRLILLSATYRQSSRPTAAGLARDANSRLLWRYPPRRMEAEAIRDNILLVSGSLDTRMEGPGFLAFHPNSNYARNWIAKDEFGPPEFRRMLYATKLRMEQDAVFGAFDCPDGGQVAPRRTESTTPIQSLNLLNSHFVVDQAERFAKRVRREVGEDVTQQVVRAFVLTIGREPAGEERAAAVELVDQHGLPALCRALYNANGFLYLR